MSSPAGLTRGSRSVRHGLRHLTGGQDEPGHDELRERANAVRGREAKEQRYLIACGLIGEPVPPVMTSGAPQKKNS